MLLKIDKKIDSLPHVWIDPTIEVSSDAEFYAVGFGFTPSLIQVHHVYSRTFHQTILDTPNLLQHGNEESSATRLRGPVLQKSKTSLVSQAVCNAYDQYAGFIEKDSMICTVEEGGSCKLNYF